MKIYTITTLCICLSYAGLLQATDCPKPSDWVFSISEGGACAGQKIVVENAIKIFNSRENPVPKGYTLTWNCTEIAPIKPETYYKVNQSTYRCTYENRY